MVTLVEDAEGALRLLRAAGVERGALIGLAVASALSPRPSTIGIAVDGCVLGATVARPADIVGPIEAELRPRWVWWSNDTATALIDDGLRVATCWDLSAAHRIVVGGWRADIARIWAQLNDLDLERAPQLGRLDLLGPGDDGNDDEPLRADGFLRAEWLVGAWSESPRRAAQWAAIALAAQRMQQARLARLTVAGDAVATARSESAAELLCAELAHDGLPLRRAIAEDLIRSAVGDRPRDESDAARQRAERDGTVLQHLGPGTTIDLRNPAEVRSMLRRVGIDVPDTRAWRLEAMRTVHPVVDAPCAIPSRR